MGAPDSRRSDRLRFPDRQAGWKHEVEEGGSRLTKPAPQCLFGTARDQPIERLPGMDDRDVKKGKEPQRQELGDVCGPATSAAPAPAVGEQKQGGSSSARRCPDGAPDGATARRCAPKRHEGRSVEPRQAWLVRRTTNADATSASSPAHQQGQPGRRARATARPGTSAPEEIHLIAIAHAQQQGARQPTRSPGLDRSGYRLRHQRQAGTKLSKCPPPAKTVRIRGFQA